MIPSLSIVVDIPLIDKQQVFAHSEDIGDLGYTLKMRQPHAYGMITDTSYKFDKP